jgi:F-type H+-transporting ATPase subunit gamma
MSRERVLQRRIRTLETLDEAVSALRSLSAQHFRAARAPLAEVRAYRDEVQKFLAVIEPPMAGGVRPGPTGIVLVAADLGLVGDYTARLVREALALRAESGPGPLVCLGHRALSFLRKAGVEPVSVQPSPTSVGGLTGLLLPLVDTLLALRGRGQLDSLWLVAARFEGAGHYRPVRVKVLPVEPPPEMEPIEPSPYTDMEQLRTVVAREVLFASLYETLLEALASEHGKRLVTAESARSWLEDRIDATQRRVSALRREASTQEVLEIVAAGHATRPVEGGPS